MMAIDLNNKVALITGGSRGIGRAIALRLAESGAHIAINFLRNRKEAETTAQEIQKISGKTPLLLKGNVGDTGDLEKIFNEFITHYKTLDILINNAASGVLKSALELTDKHWHWTMDINALALLPLTQKAVSLMKSGGKIVAISSLGSTRAIPNYAAVGASKAALESLVRHLALELAPRGININVVSAGIVDTDALKHFPNRTNLLDGSLKRTPAGRLTTTDDVADVVLFAVSPLANMIHGQTIIVDGGYSIVA